MHRGFRIALWTIGGLATLLFILVVAIVGLNIYSSFNRQMRHSTNLTILAKNKLRANYYLYKVLANPDGTFMAFSRRYHPKAKESDLVILKLDKNYQQLWEKTLPGTLVAFRNDVGRAGQNYVLLCTTDMNKVATPALMTFDPEGKLLSNRIVKLDPLPSANISTRFLVTDKQAYICYHDIKKSLLRLATIDIASAKVIRNASTPLVCDSLYLNQMLYNPADKAIEIVSYRWRQKLWLHRFAANQKFTTRVEKELPGLITAGLDPAGGGLVLTTEEDTTSHSKRTLNLYRPEAGKLSPVMTYAPAEPAVYADNFLIRNGTYYICMRYDNTPDITDLAVLKLNKQGKLLSSTKIWTDNSEVPAQFFASPNGNLIVTGTTFGYIPALGSRPFMAAVDW